MFEIINAFLYCGLFYYLFRKGANRLALFVISIWAVSAVLGIFYTKMDIYKYRSNDLEELQLLPFFYLFVCFVLCVRPLIKLSNLNISIKCNTRLLDYCGILFTILSVPFFIECVYQLVDFAISGRFLLLGANYDDLANCNADALITFSSFGRKASAILSWSKVVTPILFFINLQRSDSNKYVTIGLFLAAVSPALSNITIGSKTQLVVFLIYFISLYLFFSKSLGDSIKSKVKKLITGIGAVSLAIVISLSVGRYVLGDYYSTSNAETSDYLYKYSAESMYNFNQNAYHEENTLMGYFTALPVLNILGIDNTDVSDYVDHAEKKLHCNPVIFYGLIGDLVIDFGLLGAFLILLLLSLPLSRIRFDSDVSLSKMILYCLYIYIVSNSLFYFILKLNWDVIYVTLAFALLFSLSSKKQIQV